ncbi:MAG: YggT family protein, partial [Pseudomonadota bacterium]
FLVTEPLLRTIRKVLPSLGAIDISPIVAILALKSIEIFASSLLPPL